MQNADNVDSDPNVLKKTEQVVTELIATEKDYVADLECIIQGYLNEFDSAGSKIPQELYNQKHVVFGNIKQIYKFHKKVFLSELKACAGQPLQIGNVFIGKLEEFEMYATYCKNKPSTEDLRAEYLNLPFFKVRGTLTLTLTAFIKCDSRHVTCYFLQPFLHQFTPAYLLCRGALVVSFLQPKFTVHSYENVSLKKVQSIVVTLGPVVAMWLLWWHIP